MHAGQVTFLALGFEEVDDVRIDAQRGGLLGLGFLRERTKPFKWIKTAEDILTRERRALDKLDQMLGN